MYTYFVSYNCMDKDGYVAVANNDVVLKSPIESIEDVRSIEEALMRKGNYKQVIVLHWKLLITKFYKEVN